MKLGISTYTYTWAFGVAGMRPAVGMTVFDLLDRARRRGVPVVQVADNGPLSALSGPDLERFAELARESAIEIEVGTRGISPAHLTQCLSIAGTVGSRILRVVIDAPGEHPSPQQATETLSGLRSAFVSAGVVLAIENHDRFSVSTLGRMVRDLGTEWAGICLDTVNSFGALEGPGVVVDTLGPLTVNLHVKDFRVARAPHGMGFMVEGTPAGLGMLDVPWLLEAIGGNGRDVNAILELWTPPEAAVDATIAKESAWAEQSISYLQAELARHGDAEAQRSRR